MAENWIYSFNFGADGTAFDISSFEVELPAILKLSPASKIFLSVALCVIVVSGLKLKKSICDVLASPASKSVLVVALQWMEELIAVPLFIQIVFYVIAINMSEPTSRYLGKFTLFHLLFYFWALVYSATVPTSNPICSLRKNLVEAYLYHPFIFSHSLFQDSDFVTSCI